MAPSKLRRLIVVISILMSVANANASINTGRLKLVRMVRRPHIFNLS